MIKVLIVDDHDLVRVGLRHILARSGHIKVVGEAGNGKLALKLYRQFKPDVILLDISMPGMSGFEVTHRIRQASPATKIIVLTMHGEAPFPSRLLEAGAAGYLTKTCDAGELVTAIDAVYAGERYVGTGIAQGLALSLLPGCEYSPFEELSSREMEVALMLTQGTNVPSISEEMSLSPKTVATYKYRIYDKLQIRNEVDLIRMAYQFGLMKEVNPYIAG